MNDERFQHTVGAWLRDEDPAPPDSLRSARQVADRLPLVRQQSRWWPLPLLRRTPAPTRATDTTEYQPSPIPASNGHSPTVIGRTSSMLSPVKAITAGALVFAIGGAFLIAQPFGQQGSVPGAATDPALMHAVPVSGSFTAFFGSEVPDPDAPGLHSSGPLRITVNASDPRLQVSGVLETASWWQASDDPEVGLDVSVEFGTWELANDEGGWVGTGTVIEPDTGPSLTVLELEGLGAYDGQTASLLMQWGPSEFSFEGAIVPSELFPAPEAMATQ